MYKRYDLKRTASAVLKRRLKAAAFEVIRRYHRVVPPFVELYAGHALRPGPAFAKEAQFLHAMARLTMPLTVVEIGVGGASSTIAFAEALHLNGRGRLVSIDISTELIQRAQALLKAHRLDAYCTIIEGRSTNPKTRAKLQELAPNIDILFIDGDHSFSGCLEDFNLYQELVSPGGVIVFHDTGAFPPDQAELVASLPVDDGEGAPTWNEDRSGIYHRPDVARVIDVIVTQRPEYSVLALQTLAQPCCGMAVLQKTQRLYQPGEALLAAE